MVLSGTATMGTVGSNGLGEEFGASGAPGAADGRLAGEAVLTLLGSWSLSLEGRTVMLPWSAQRLLVLLALQGRLRRSYVAGTLWPDVRDDNALTRLRSALWRLRRQTPGLVEVDEQTVALSTVRVDVHDLVTVARQLAEKSVEPSMLTWAFGVLVDARELLLGWYDDWVLEERERLTSLRIHALEMLVDELVQWRRYAEALDAALTAVRLDPLRESTHRSVVRVHLAEGNPASARRAVDRFRSLLLAEVGSDEVTPLMLDLIGARP